MPVVEAMIGAGGMLAIVAATVVPARRMFAGMMRRDRPRPGRTPAMLQPADEELARVVEDLCNRG